MKSEMDEQEGEVRRRLDGFIECYCAAEAGSDTRVGVLFDAQKYLNGLPGVGRRITEHLKYFFAGCGFGNLNF